MRWSGWLGHNLVGATDAEERIVLEHLAADGAAADHEEGRAGKLVAHGLPHAGTLWAG